MLAMVSVPAQSLLEADRQVPENLIYCQTPSTTNTTTNLRFEYQFLLQRVETSKVRPRLL